MGKFVLGFVCAIAALVAYPALQRSGEADHRKLVRAKMIDPASAVFGPDFQSLRSPAVWCGEVNGKNRLGAMAGSRRYIAFLKDGEVSLEGETESVALTGDGGAVFAGRWKVFCK